MGGDTTTGKEKVEERRREEIRSLGMKMRSGRVYQMVLAVEEREDTENEEEGETGQSGELESEEERDKEEEGKEERETVLDRERSNSETNTDNTTMMLNQTKQNSFSSSRVVTVKSKEVPHTQAGTGPQNQA